MIVVRLLVPPFLLLLLLLSSVVPPILATDAAANDPPTSRNAQQRRTTRTRPPRTRRPRPTRRPTPGPAPLRTRRPTPIPTTTPPDWFVDYATSRCVMDCVDEPRRPCGGRRGQWQDSFPTAEACCASISWVAAEDCKATASPTGERTDAPAGGLEEEAQAALLPGFDWYVKRTTNTCVQHCDGEPGVPCGGLAGIWENLYPSLEECCASVPWKPFDDCASATASPVTTSPTTSIPTVSPTASVSPSASSVPTSAMWRRGRPSSSPSSTPTYDCASPRPYWYLYRNEAKPSTCANDDALSGETPFHLRFESAEGCCGSPFAGFGECRIVDVCDATAANARWYGDYSRGWDDGVCVDADGAPDAVPRGRRTYGNEKECCSEAFYGQSSKSCLSNAV